MKIFVQVSLACLGVMGFSIKSHAQVVNIGDTMSISNGSFIYVPGDMQLVDSAGKYPYILNNGTIKISGSFVKSPFSIYKGGNDSLILTGKDSQLFPGFSYYRFLADSGGNKYTAGNPEIRNAMFLKNKSIVVTGNDTVVLDSVANIHEDDTDYVLGKAVYTKYLRQSFYYLNGSIGLETEADSAVPKNTVIFRETGKPAIQNGFCSQGIERYFQVLPKNTASAGATILFHYFPHELNGISLKDLWLFQSPDSGKNWYKVDSIFNDTFAYTVAASPKGPFERYTLGNLLNPLVNPIKAGKAQAVCSGDPVQLGDSAVGNHVYSWTSNPAGFTSNSSHPIVNPTVTTTYFLKEIAPSTACVNTDSVTVTVSPWPAYRLENNRDLSRLYFSGKRYWVQKLFLGFWRWHHGNRRNRKPWLCFRFQLPYQTFGIRWLWLHRHQRFGGLFQRERAGILKIYPNPFTDYCNIQFMLCNNSNVNISLCDMRGREIATIVNGELDEGFHQYKIDFIAHNWNEAMYLVKLKIGDKFLVNKVIGMK